MYNLNTFFSTSREKLMQDTTLYPNERLQPDIAKKFGHISGAPVGTKWDTRCAWLSTFMLLVINDCNYRELCSKAGVHTPTIAGISGSRYGAYSIVLSGAYEDDEDNGDTM
jgi:hypothetical protein